MPLLPLPRELALAPLAHQLRIALVADAEGERGAVRASLTDLMLREV
ncbi:MAG: hypothetical protein LKI40_01445 [Olsenella sp.]|jgi:hypothetical protein|nr:hypothetical protein [Olsenella sp.]MCI1792699.1 hypothetical protein [Olsenella sp.]